jgi:hypothetical protein
MNRPALASCFNVAASSRLSGASSGANRDRFSGKLQRCENLSVSRSRIAALRSFTDKDAISGWSRILKRGRNGQSSRDKATRSHGSSKGPAELIRGEC